LRIKKVSHLKPGEEFIWGDDRTRKNLVVNLDYLGPLICTDVDTENDVIHFLPADAAKEDMRYYEDCSTALVVDTSRESLVDFAVTCQSCLRKYGSHAGLDCQSESKGEYSGGFFVPSDLDMVKYHPEYAHMFGAAVEDFFSSIGL
jgi:hypothetical protein